MSVNDKLEAISNVIVWGSQKPTTEADIQQMLMTFALEYPETYQQVEAELITKLTLVYTEADVLKGVADYLDSRTVGISELSRIIRALFK